MKMLRVPEINGHMGWRSATSLYNAVRTGLCTKPVKIGRRSVALPDYEVVEINTARISGKSDDEIRELVKRLHAERIELAITS